MQYPKRLIEVDLPIARISAHSRREKSIRHGHISTLHIWWARRPLAACRAVICASLWPDPADEICPQEFRDAAVEQITAFADRVFPKKLTAEGKLLSSEKHLSMESRGRWEAIVGGTLQLDATEPADMGVLRLCLLDFIADFANWDNSIVPAYLETSRALTQSAHEALGGIKGTRPLVVDPFAGGGSIPLESLRIGADAFGSDLNPVALALNQVSLEFLPKFGVKLAEEIRRWGGVVKERATKKLANIYPSDPDGSTPIAYIWGRSVVCEGPGCGAQVPLVKQPILRRDEETSVAIGFVDKGPEVPVGLALLKSRDTKKAKPTCSAFKLNCPREKCSFTTPKPRIQAQLTKQHGGADDATLLAVLTDGESGRNYRLPSKRDEKAINAARRLLKKKIDANGIDIIPDEPLPDRSAHRAVGSQLPLYGFESWGDLFTARQKVALLVFQEIARDVYLELEASDEQLASAVFTLLAFAIDKQADYASSLCRWVPGGEFIAGTLGGEKKLPMLSDFAESNPIGFGSGAWEKHIDWIARYVERESNGIKTTGTVSNNSADTPVLPSDSAAAMITDPPYYDSVPYADLSDFYFVWLKRTLGNRLKFSNTSLTPKDQEATVNHPRDKKQLKRYESILASAFAAHRDITMPSGLGVIVFAHKSTDGWEALLEAIIQGGWVVTASWPIDSERSSRLNALNTASLNSSVHIVCRPRENPDGSLREEIGEWRDVLAELPKRIHEWMPRLAAEGVVGADSIFACIGPALEVFSRFSRVEKASGEAVTLKEYLEQVWAAVSTEALSMIFKDADAAGLEPDARITAMWLWTLGAGTGDSNGNGSDDKVVASKGYTLEFDAARKIAQGLGIHLEDSESIVEVKKDKARLLPVSERTRHLFGKSDADASTARGRKKKKEKQGRLFEELDELESESEISGELKPQAGETVLDRVHQSMILFASGRGEALRRFLVDDGAGNDARFWKLAQSLSALYPKETDEKRWVDGVLARKKGLGL